MPEDETRKLLKLFGIALTDFEDQTAKMLESLHTAGSQPLRATLARVEEWLKANGQVMARWVEVTQMLVAIQAKAQAELVRVLPQMPERHG
jgi:hypothetical protein